MPCLLDEDDIISEKSRMSILLVSVQCPALKESMELLSTDLICSGWRTVTTYMDWAPWKWEEPGGDMGTPGTEEDFASAATWGTPHSVRLVRTPLLKGFSILNQCSTLSSICNYTSTGLIAKEPQGCLAGSWKQEELNPPSPTLKFFLLNLLCFTAKAMVNKRCFKRIHITLLAITRLKNTIISRWEL